ncbi:hypothetical protein [Bradyrhizobium sp. HKCCYLR20261]|uniref:hypothetical protein n=1 Tax=unclassified Bradyrhizobium TaxID=2631580 RepID=UPI003EB98D86
MRLELSLPCLCVVAAGLVLGVLSSPSVSRAEPPLKLVQAPPEREAPAPAGTIAPEPAKPRPAKPAPPNGSARAAPAPAPLASGIAAPAVDAAGLSQPQTPEPVMHAARAGLGPCLPAVERGAASSIDAPHNAVSNWYPGAPNLHAFSSIAAQTYPSAMAPRAASILLATPSATGCDASAIQVFPTARSCADVEQEFLKSGPAIGRVAGLPVFKMNGGHRLLMPSAGNGCVIIGLTVQYVPAAPPPPPSIVAPSAEGAGTQPQAAQAKK